MFNLGNKTNKVIKTNLNKSLAINNRVSGSVVKLPDGKDSS